MDGALALCLGGHRFDSRRGLRFFLCSTLVTMLIISFSNYFVSLSLKFSIFHCFRTHCDIDIADRNSMQDTCQLNLVYGLALH